MRPVLCLLVLALVSFGVSAGTISEFGGGTGILVGEYHFGQMVVTPSGGPWDDISFSMGSGYFFDPGRLYLLSQEYLGLPSNLASAPGLLATSISTTQFAWIFDSSVILQPNTTYYFYEDGTRTAVVYFPPNGDTIGPFTGYRTQGWPNLNTPFQETLSNNYRLTSDPVPEPAPVAFLLLGLATFLIARWRIAGMRPR
jgi:hypothetical protein